MAMLGTRRKTVKPGWEQAVSLRNDPFDFGQIAARADGIFGPRDDMADAAPIGIPQTDMGGFAAPRIKPRFFGQGGAGRKIAGALGDALLTATGGQPIYAPAMRGRQEFEERSRLFREKLDFEREEAETKRNAPMQVGDNVVQYDPATGGYKSLYSAPPELTQFQRDLAAVGIAPDSEEARQIMRNRYNPFKTAEIPDGEGGKITVQTGGAPWGGALSSGSSIEQAASAAIPGLTVTSRQRSPEKNRAVGGRGNSFHLTDQARDFVPPAGMSMADMAARLRQAMPGFDVINEGDHVHVEPSSRGPRVLGRTPAKPKPEAKGQFSTMSTSDLRARLKGGK